ncbi:MAG: hypothetical protein OEO79_00290 [Gemmatimonadota bacterium]|nr:hypothetical protein [Gemmatimonadota bacterium]
MLLDRERTAGKYLEWKVRLFSVAAVVALAGIYTERRWVTGAAILILVSALSLRFLPSHAEDSETTEEG